MRLTWTARTLTLRAPFRIARGVTSAREAVEVTLDHDGVRGYGEVVTSRYYALDVATIDATLRRLADVAAAVPAGDLDALAWVGARSPIPVVADEDARTAADIERLAGAVQAVNIKLAESGGIDGALAMAAAAERAGLAVMLGCLAASSLSQAPAVHLAPLARWLDLDGHLLLAGDPWRGIGGENGQLTLPAGPGLGIRRR